MNKTKTFFIVLCCMLGLSASAQSLHLKLEGDSASGYYVDIYNDETLVSSDNKSGELSIYVENADYSIKERIHHWKATTAENVTEKQIKLSGVVSLLKLETDIKISVIYDVKTEQVCEKRIELFQSNIPLLYYSLNVDITPSEPPTQFWSFDNVDNKGGIVHETFPAAGYFLDNNLAVGLLTDAGNKNLWTRNIRRRPSTGEIGFRAIREICDANLYRISSKQYSAEKENFVRLTFGEVSDFNHPKKEISYPIPDILQWKSYHGATVTYMDKIWEISDKHATADREGVRIPYHFQDGFYTVRFKHQSTKPINLRLWKGDETSNVEVAGFHYQSNIPSSDTAWIQQEETVFLANTEGKQTYLLIAASDVREGESYSLRIKDFEIVQSVGNEHAYHTLFAGKKELKRIFICTETMQPTLHDVRLASQIHLADGLDFHGSKEEKCLYSCYQMLMWITGRNNFSSLSVPSVNYAPDMYNRDSFWSLMGVNDKDASEQIFNAWANTQNELGAIGTIVTPMMGSKEQKGNEATLEFLWFALVNKRRYGIEPPQKIIERAFAYCVNEFDPDKDGICRARFILGQNDVIEFPNWTSDVSVNQGMWAVTLRVAKELGFDISNQWIENANACYRSFYNKKKGYLIDNKKFDYVISFNSLLPEFSSWWLFNEPILTDEMVNNTLDHIPYKNGYSPIMAHVKDIYFNNKNKPFSPNMAWDNGIYYNGGSWMREEICGYVAGLKHGWKPARKRINDRLKVEITLHPDEPFSHEFLPYDLSTPNCWWPSTRVFSWNVFVLKALEVANMR